MCPLLEPCVFCLSLAVRIICLFVFGFTVRACRKYLWGTIRTCWDAKVTNSPIIVCSCFVLMSARFFPYLYLLFFYFVCVPWCDFVAVTFTIRFIMKFKLWFLVTLYMNDSFHIDHSRVSEFLRCLSDRLCPLQSWIQINEVHKMVLDLQCKCSFHAIKSIQISNNFWRNWIDLKNVLFSQLFLRITIQLFVAIECQFHFVFQFITRQFHDNFLSVKKNDSLLQHAHIAHLPIGLLCNMVLHNEHPIEMPWPFSHLFKLNNDKHIQNHRPQHIWVVNIRKRMCRSQENIYQIFAVWPARETW